MELMTPVLLPGLDGTGRLFTPLLPMLPSWLKPHVIAYPVDTFLDYSALHDYVCERLPRKEPFVLLGESFSGPVAVSIAANAPRNLNALILCATFVTNPTPFPSLLGKLIFNRLLFSITPPDFIVRWFLIGKDAPLQLTHLVQEVIASVPPVLLAARIQEVLQCDARDALRKCTLPTLYLRATRDRIVRAKAMREILETYPQASAETLSAPHFLLQREPEKATEVIKAFLEQGMRL